MGLFRRTATRRQAVQPGSGVALLEGYEALEVVGESFHQDSLWSLVGGRGDPEDYVRTEIFAVLTAEPDNPYDSKAVAVSIDGLKVGHLSREDARRYQPGLLELQRKYGRPIALRGVIVGGGIREDGPGRLGVFLSHHPEDFGIVRATPVGSEPGIRTGLSEVLGSSASRYPDELARLTSLPKTDVSAIPALRRLLWFRGRRCGRRCRGAVLVGRIAVAVGWPQEVHRFPRRIALGADTQPEALS